MKSLSKRIVFLLAFTTLFIGKAGILYSQNQNNFWFFGNEAGINFNSGTPVSITTGQMLSIEGCATVSDPVTGNLLFYTNGLQIWSANHVVMPNGNGLLGGASTSSTQGALIVPFPNNPGRFFVFTVDESIGGAVNGFRYSVVNMNLNGGLGDVIPGQKNILIQNNVTERLAVAVKGDSSGYWVMIHERGNNIFKAYSVDQNGLNTSPVISAVGAVHTTTAQANGNETMGAMKFNHAYTKLAVALFAGNKVQVFDFNNCSGIVSNTITINTIDNPYGLEFSPDNSRLYYGLYSTAVFSGAVYQVNMLAPNPAATSVIVGVSSSFNFQCMGALQLAPDGKIYISINSEMWLSGINNPNNLGISCGFIDKAIILQQVGLFPSPGLLGLPQIVPFVNGTITPSLTTISICQNQLPFVWNGIVFNAAGSYSVTLTNSAGCDSIANLDLILASPAPAVVSFTTCFDQLPFIYNGQSFVNPGTYTQTLLNAAGCDSIVTLILNIQNNPTSTTTISVCADQLPFVWNGQSFNAAGNYSVTLTSAAGCDSIAALNLTLLNTSSSTSSISVCPDQLPYTWNGQSFNAAGNYTVTLTNAAGCDSIAALNLSLLSTTSSTTNISICPDQLPYTWNGQSFNAAGNYSVTLTNAAGCDSIAALNLSLLNTTSSTTNISICPDQLPYIWNGQSFNAAGNYSVTLTNAAGCDSIAALNLTIVSTITSTTAITVCPDQLPFIWNGQSFVNAGTYSVTITNAGSCDSIATLVLGVATIPSSTTNLSLCADQLPFNWNGQTYNAAGSYAVTLTNSAGCDSVANLNLAVLPILTSVTTLSVCTDQLPYSWNGQSIPGAGNYTATLTGSTGCDSLASLNLSVNATSSSTSDLLLCADQLPLSWNSLTISAAGTYTVSFINAAGCDSSVTLNLSVTAVDTTSSSVTLCSNQLPYQWNGISILNEGQYFFILTASTGCDSVLLLNVTIDNGAADNEILSTGVCAGDVTQFELNSSANITSIIWTFGDPLNPGYTDTTLQPAFVYNVPGSYPITAIISNGCSTDTIIETIVILDCDTFNLGCNIYLPNAFTPNSDGLNERFSPVFDCPAEKFSFAIYNRWGQLIFATNDSSTAWDGTYEKTECPMGVYVADLSVKLIDGKRFNMKKLVTLLR